MANPKDLMRSALSGIPVVEPAPEYVKVREIRDINPGGEREPKWKSKYMLRRWEKNVDDVKAIRRRARQLGWHPCWRCELLTPNPDALCDYCWLEVQEIPLPWTTSQSNPVAAMYPVHIPEFGYDPARLRRRVSIKHEATYFTGPKIRMGRGFGSSYTTGPQVQPDLGLPFDWRDRQRDRMEDEWVIKEQYRKDWTAYIQEYE